MVGASVEPGGVIVLADGRDVLMTARVEAGHSIDVVRARLARV